MSDSSLNNFSSSLSSVGYNQSLWGCAFGFYNKTNHYDKILPIYSSLAIIPIIGFFPYWFLSSRRGGLSFLESNVVNNKEKHIFVFLFILRSILTCFGLGILFFILDLIYTLGCYLEGKMTSKN